MDDNNIADAQAQQSHRPKDKPKPKVNDTSTTEGFLKWGKRLLGKRLRREASSDEEPTATAEAVNPNENPAEKEAWNFTLTEASPDERIAALLELSLKLKEKKEEFQEKACLLKHELILERRVFDTKVEMMKAEIEEKERKLRSLEREWEEVERDLERRADAADAEMLSRHARESRTKEERRDRGEEKALKRHKNEAMESTTCREMKIEVESVGSEASDIDHFNLSEITLISIDISRGESSNMSPFGSEVGDVIERRD